MLRQRAKEKGIVLKHYLSHEISTLWADRRMLKQIVIYILSNSLKFTENKGCPSIPTELTDDRARCLYFSIQELVSTLIN